MDDVTDLPEANEPASTPAITLARKTFEQAGILLSEIATLAAAIDRECYFSGDSRGSADMDLEIAQLRIERMRAAVSLMGWLADSCAD